MSVSRRAFLRQSTQGLAAFGAGALLLGDDARATEPSVSADVYRGYLGRGGERAATRSAEPAESAVSVPAMRATEDNILGPFHRPGAPYRAKITPPREPGQVLVIHGQVWGLDTRRPLPGAVLDIWQANAEGRYDNDDPNRPVAKGVYRNRARLISDESGYYEFESILPGRYQIDTDVWRPRHIHYLIRHPGYRELVTQLYFRGDPYNQSDAFIKSSLIIELREVGEGDRKYNMGIFDVVLAPANAKR